MCGLAGILNLAPQPAVDRASLERMAGAIRHRGPDEFGVYRDAQCGLAHARLSVIDIASGQQPMANEDRTLWIVYNGEIFNYLELRSELAAMGHRFRTNSDTEVLLHAYEAWGSAAFTRFNGQWAAALWNARTGTLVLSRDRLGVRPLFYCQHGGRLYFASEVKAIFAADPSIPRKLDPVGLEQTFTFWSVVPPRAVFAGVSELEPGHVRTVTASGVSDIAYWDCRYPRSRDGGEAFPAFQGSVDEAAVAVRDALERATRLRMLRADVPVGCYLSGGIDSSLVATLGLRAKGERFKTFSVRFEDAEYDETAYQRLMVDHIGSDHQEIVCSRRDIADAFPAVVAHTERPILRTAPAPMYLLSAAVRRAGIKVVLTGEGADEVFAGYDLFREGKVRRFMARAPQSQRRAALLERLYPYLARSPVASRAMARRFFGRDLDKWREPGFAHGTRWHTTSALKRLLAPAVREAARAHDVLAEFTASLPREFSKWSPLAQDQYIEIKTLLGGYILSSQGDRMLMAHSVEGRFPFLDKDVVELANSLPAAYKLKVLDEKHVLKLAARDLVPRRILDRKKQPYRAPDALSFVGDSVPDWVGAAMEEEALAKAGVFDPQAVRRLWSKCRNERRDAQFSNADNMAVVGVLSTQLLHETLIARPPEGRAVRPHTVEDRVEARPMEAAR